MAQSSQGSAVLLPLLSVVSGVVNVHLFWKCMFASEVQVYV